LEQLYDLWNTRHFWNKAYEGEGEKN